jgi:hypothetical protein
MTTEEINDVFRQLSEILHEVGLAWLEEAVNADINGGAVEIVAESDLPVAEGTDARVLELRRSVKDFDLTPPRTRRSEQEFLRSREYSAEEKLLTLIDAIEETVIHASDIETVLGDQFIRKANLKSIAFLDEGGWQPISLEPSAALPRHQAAENLKRLLVELRTEVRE